MGIWRFAGAFTVVERQSNAGLPAAGSSKTAGMHVSQPTDIRECVMCSAFNF
jgi:hypothetical protein